MLNLIGEWNGFDINLGAQLDFGGIRVGGFLLGANYAEKISTYRSKKFGILGSIALCPNSGTFCQAGPDRAGQARHHPTCQLPRQTRS